MKPDENKIWFPAKRYGWGWGPPNCWQGWAVIAAYVALTFAGTPLLASKHTVLWFAYIVILSLALIVICWLKGEKPRWRWGDK
jgi:hypothetical protein